MAPSRFQCLNVATRIAKNGFSARAEFSTSQARRVDEPSNTSSASDLLSSISPSSTTDAPSSTLSQAGRSSTLPQANLNPISMPSKSNDANDEILRLFRESKQRNDEIKKAAEPGAIQTLAEHLNASNYGKHITRRWRAGDTYAPHDLSGVEMKKWRQGKRPTHDMFDVLAFNPEEHYRNFNIMSEFMTPMGRIAHSKDTGLRPVNQRRIARAIRRAIGIGMMPSVHRHPEILYRERERSSERYKRTSGAPAPL